VKKERISQAHSQKKKNTQDLIPNLLLFIFGYEVVFLPPTNKFCLEVQRNS
jgi:hypothetical protein